MLYDAIATEDNWGKGRFKMLRLIGDVAPIMVYAAYGHSYGGTRVKAWALIHHLFRVTRQNMPPYLVHQTGDRQWPLILDNGLRCGGQGGDRIFCYMATQPHGSPVTRQGARQNDPVAIYVNVPALVDAGNELY